MKTKTGTIQIIAIVLALVTLVFISAMWYSHKSILAVDLAQEDLRAYVGIVSKKAPEYAATALEKGAYQAIYEVGMRGGFRKDTTFSRKNVSVLYESTSVPTAIWREYGDVSNIPSMIPFQYDLSKVTEKIVRDTLARYAPMYDLDVSDYNTAMYTVLRVPCGIEYGADNNKWCLDANITGVKTLNKRYTVSNTKIADAFVFGETYERISVRLPGMYDLMDNFMRNNFPANTGKDGGTPYNLLSKQIEETTACPGGYNCDWDQKSHITEYCPSQNNCDYSADGFNAKFDYKCVPKLVAPACKRTIRDNMKNGLKLIEAELNNNTLQLDPYKIKCPAGVSNCETEYNTPVEIYKDAATGQRYKAERFKWMLEPASPNTWNDVIKWDGNSDRYNVLWWAQSATTGDCTLPDGTVFKTDNIATLLTKPERQSTSTGIDINPWQKKTGLIPPYNEEFPEGTACADAYYVNCHMIKKYKTETGFAGWSNCCDGSSGIDFSEPPDVISWCEMDSYKTAPGHTAACTSDANGAPYNNQWCSDARTTVHYTDSHSCSCPCPWTSCPSSYNDHHEYIDHGVPDHEVETAYTHCSVQYNFYGHFKYRADIDPLLVTLTDESKLIPAEDIYGNDVNTKPILNAVYKETIREEPHDNDRCLDTESEEGNPNSRYYHASDLGKSQCPTSKNATAPRADYYEPSPCNTCTDADNTCYPAEQQVCVGGFRLEGSEYCTRCAATACADGIQNCGEIRADCGGPCAPCPTCATLVCTTPTDCCSRAEDGIEECKQPGLDSLGATCRTDCECASGSCNSTNQCYNPTAGCPTESSAPSFEKTITPADGCPLNLSIGFNAVPRTQFKIEAVYENGPNKIPIEICKTGVNCGIGAAELPSMNKNCNTSFSYSNYKGYYPWNCSASTPVVPSDYQLTKVRISSLDGSNLKLFGLEINASSITRPTRCTSCGGTSYWKNAMLWVKSILPGSCVDSSAGSTTDILGLISCEATTGNSYEDTDGNGRVNMSEVFACCDGTPPAIKIKKPVANCGDRADLGSPCNFKINVTTDKSAKCRYSEGTEAAYDSMPNPLDLSFVTKREISKSLTNAIKTYFVGCSNRIGIKTPLGSACNFTVNCTA